MLLAEPCRTHLGSKLVKPRTDSQVRLLVANALAFYSSSGEPSMGLSSEPLEECCGSSQHYPGILNGHAGAGVNHDSRVQRQGRKIGRENGVTT
jgi:hypothetical protein